MEQRIKEMCQRIKELRKVCDYSIEQLAKELGIPAETYKSYEEEGTNIPISIIYKISSIFGVDFAEILTGVKAKLDVYQVVKKGKGEEVNRFDGYHYKDLAFRYAHKIMQPLLVTLEPNSEYASTAGHSGQEFNYVLKGTMKIAIDNKEIILEEGDSIYFNATYPHAQYCISDEKVVFLTIITN